MALLPMRRLLGIFQEDLMGTFSKEVRHVGTSLPAAVHRNPFPAGRTAGIDILFVRGNANMDEFVT